MGLNTLLDPDIMDTELFSVRRLKLIIRDIKIDTNMCAELLEVMDP